MVGTNLVAMTLVGPMVAHRTVVGMRVIRGHRSYVGLMSRPDDAIGSGRVRSVDPENDRRTVLLVRAGAGAVVLCGATVIAARGVPEWEKDAFALLNSGPDGPELLLWAPMQAGSLFGPVVVGGLAWWRWRNWRPAVGSVVVGVVAWQLAKVVKAAVERGRPFELMEGFARRMGTPLEGLGFVSGHSAVAFSLAAVCSPYLSKRGRIGVFALAVVVGLARIQVSAHLPLDVVGGAGLGYGLGQMWNFAVGVPRGKPGVGNGSGAVDPGWSRLE